MIKVRFVDKYALGKVEIYVWDEVDGGRFFAKIVDGMVTFVANAVKGLDMQSVEPEPFIVIDSDKANDFIKAFGNEINRNKIELESDSMMRGKCESMTIHLEDMREMNKQMLKHILGI